MYIYKTSYLIQEYFIIFFARNNFSSNSSPPLKGEKVVKSIDKLKSYSLDVQKARFKLSRMWKIFMVRLSCYSYHYWEMFMAFHFHISHFRLQTALCSNTRNNFSSQCSLYYNIHSGNFNYTMEIISLFCSFHVCKSNVLQQNSSSSIVVKAPKVKKYVFLSWNRFYCDKKCHIA